MQKANVINDIKDCFSRDNIYKAVECWFSSYQSISTEEFLECCEEFTPTELLEILEDHKAMINRSIQDIEEFINE